jgi:hypothetical protein
VLRTLEGVKLMFEPRDAVFWRFFSIWIAVRVQKGFVKGYPLVI